MKYIFQLVIKINLAKPGRAFLIYCVWVFFLNICSKLPAGSIHTIAHLVPLMVCVLVLLIKQFCLILYFKCTSKIILQGVLYSLLSDFHSTTFYSLFFHHEDNLRLVSSWRPAWSGEKQEGTTVRSLWGLNPISVFSMGSCTSVPINLQYGGKKADAIVPIPALLKKAL